MVDAEFGDPRLAAVYDVLDPDRRDLAVYVDLVTGLGARRAVDVGCGTGTFALLLADLGLEVLGVDPARASLDVARTKPGARRVRWVEGRAGAVRVTDQDVVTMTANVAQAIADPDDWSSTLRAAFQVLRPDGWLVLETRDPAARAWTAWTREETERTVDLGVARRVTTWTEVVEVAWPLVTFRSAWDFSDGPAALTSTSTLRFRSREEVEADLDRHGFDVVEVRDAPDRPGRELVFLARRRSEQASRAAGPWSC